MSSTTPPPDTPNYSKYITGNVSYDLIVLTKMVAILPDNIQKPLAQQINKVADSLLSLLAGVATRDQLIKSLVDQHRLNSIYIEFDLEATRRERDMLIERLKRNNDNDAAT